MSLTADERIQLILGAARIGVWSWDVQSGAVEWDQRMEELFGLIPGTFAGRYDAWKELVHPEDLTLVETSLRRALAGEASDDIVYRVRDSQGSWRHILTRGLLLGDVQGQRMSGVCMDITELRRSELELLESERTMHVLFRDAVDGIITIDTQGTVESMNPAAERIFGYDAAEVVGSNVKLLMPAPYREEHDGYLRAYLETGERKMLGTGREVVGRRKDGSTFSVELAISVVRAGERVLFAGILRDMSDRKRMEQELQAARDSLEQRVRERTAELHRSNQDLEQFAYIASHDLQEPLRMVASYLQLLEMRYQDKLGDDARDFIAFAVDGARRMKQLINDLLVYSRVGSRRKEFELVDCEQVLRETLANLQVVIEESGAAITHDVLPRVRGDKSQLVQLFQNLIGNAIKYRSERSPTVHIRAEPLRAGEWQFSSADNGIGIDPKHADRVFVIFQRLHSGNKFSGTGIGLAVCKRIVERHGGRIWVDSQPGTGSTFFFTISTTGGEADR